MMGRNHKASSTVECTFEIESGYSDAKYHLKVEEAIYTSLVLHMCLENKNALRRVYNSKEDDIPGIYGVQGYPTKIIIDPEGQINKIILGESDEFYEYIDRLFGQS